MDYSQLSIIDVLFEKLIMSLLTSKTRSNNFLELFIVMEKQYVHFLSIVIESIGHDVLYLSNKELTCLHLRTSYR